MNQQALLRSETAESSSLCACCGRQVVTSALPAVIRKFRHLIAPKDQANAHFQKGKDKCPGGSFSSVFANVRPFASEISLYRRNKKLILGHTSFRHRRREDFVRILQAELKVEDGSRRYELILL